MTAAKPGQFDVLVIAGSGVGHFHPIAAFAATLTDPGRVAYLTDLLSDEVVRHKAERDGSTVMEWSVRPSSRHVGRAMQTLRQLATRRLAPVLARRESAGAPLPGLLPRTVFALGCLIRPIEASSPNRGQRLDDVLREVRPRLVLAEGYDDWLRVLCAHHGIAWARFVTGPVPEASARRPIEPGGFHPGLRGAESVANRVLLALNRVRARLGQRRVRTAAARMGRTGAVEPLDRFAFSCAAIDDIAKQPTTWSYAGLSPYHPPANWRATPPPRRDRDTVIVSWGSGPEPADAPILDLLVPLLAELATSNRIVIQLGDEALRSRMAERVAPIESIEVRGLGADPDYELFGRARVVIGHGGYNTINEAVAFGAPVVVLSRLVADRLETARRVEHSAVGTSLNRYTVTAEGLSEAITRAIEDERISRAVARSSRMLRDERSADQIRDRLLPALRG